MRSSGGGFGTLLAGALQRLEARFGDLRSLSDARSARVLREARLSGGALRALVAHECAAVVVPGWFGDAEACRAAARSVLEDPQRSNWAVTRGTGAGEAAASDVETVGTPHNVAAAAGAGALESYFAGSVAQTRKWRRPASGGGRELLGPLDKLRLELDEEWPEGCLLARDPSTRRPFLPGIPRIMRPPQRFDPAAQAQRWSRGFCHVDELDIMRRDRGLYSANVYLQCAPSGGELLVWPITFATRWDFYRHAATLSLCLSQERWAQEALWERLPPPVLVKVSEGDLVLLCTQRPHAVRGPVLGGTRVSMQGFLSFREGQPLRMEA